LADPGTGPSILGGGAEPDSAQAGGRVKTDRRDAPKLAMEKGKPTPRVSVSIARELVGFLWAITGKPYAMRAVN